MSFGGRLKMARIKKQYTQSDMARFLGITAQGYGKYEIGKSEPDIATLIRISNLLDVSIDYLAKGAEADHIEYLLKDPVTLLNSRAGNITREEAKKILNWVIDQDLK
ncbi:helix-turn-helix domain-containing protein [Bacillus altitudinis]|uniref:helix-turn-helix domain-containing protein n=1 Tax=Bacillus altitudinis TaxID=293387 RepID=UPI002282786D|nr:helix-turn-helix transcriptional regulator [Bacillus altitudinis]MCY7691785.1 helix-turn-helix domain-containing protein [Bacillus altitudinis]